MKARIAVVARSRMRARRWAGLAGLVLSISACGGQAGAPPPSASTSAAPATAAAAPAVTIAPSASPSRAPSVSARSTADRVDDFSGPQVHFMYVLPSDGVDESLDTNGRITNAISAVQTWLGGQTGGRKLRVDRAAGAPDITFFRLSASDASISASGAFVRDRIEAELKAAGFNAAGKIYAVYYGGGSTYACGGGAWPPTLPGIVAAQYLKGTPPGAFPCANNPVGANPAGPGYEEFAILHEVLHTIGIVATCAPHHTRAGHTSDDPRDLMYAGDQPWRPSILDVGHDDYYGHAIPGCANLATSPYLMP
ncbi:MAG TPA: hypothetical protein VGQ86_00155 [Candidatus Limnocylindria bacterium]|nr:hypothetical protein [Candidatus Limnocylindria bacterium]